MDSVTACVNGHLCFSSTINTGGITESLNSNIYVLLQQSGPFMYLVKTTPVKERHGWLACWLAGWLAGWLAALSGCTAAAQHGLYLSVTHKPFRAATALPELLVVGTRLPLFT